MSRTYDSGINEEGEGRDPQRGIRRDQTGGSQMEEEDSEEKGYEEGERFYKEATTQIVENLITSGKAEIQRPGELVISDNPPTFNVDPLESSAAIKTREETREEVKEKERDRNRGEILRIRDLDVSTITEKEDELFSEKKSKARSKKNISILRPNVFNSIENLEFPSFTSIDKGLWGAVLTAAYEAKKKDKGTAKNMIKSALELVQGYHNDNFLTPETEISIEMKEHFGKNVIVPWLKSFFDGVDNINEKLNKSQQGQYARPLLTTLGVVGPMFSKVVSLASVWDSFKGVKTLAAYIDGLEKNTIDYKTVLVS